MKKLVVILSMVFISTTLMANIDGNFIKTKDGTYFFKKVRVTLSSDLIGVKSTGEKVKFAKAEVQAYSRNGKLYEKMPIFEKNQYWGKTAFMQVLCYRNGLKLYEFSYDHDLKKYYVFSGNQFVFEMGYLDKESLTSFFNPK